MSLWEEFVSVQQDRAEADEAPKVPTARGAARPPIPSQALPPPVSAPPAQNGAGTDGQPGASGDAGPAEFELPDWSVERIGRHALPPDDEPGPDAPTNGHHTLNTETITLPAFVTGKRDEGKAEPTRPQPGDKLPASERGMLVFVAALLALGTVAVVAILGFGGLTSHHPPASTSHSPTPAAGALAADASPSPSPSPSDSPSPSPSPSASKKPAPPVTHKPSPSPTGTRLGTVSTSDLNSYCRNKQFGSSPQAPSKDNAGWTCQASGHQPLAFTPDDVCSYRYRQFAHAVVGKLSDVTTWTCYR
jgi:hypothetical protein